MRKGNNELVFGIHAVESALRHARENVLQVWVQQGRKDKRVADIVALAQQSGISVEAIAADKIRKKCPQGNHQGVLASVRLTQGKTVELEDVLKQENLLLLVLDEVQDPHNIGACLRTADAAGVDAVIVSRNRSPGLTPIVRKVASGAAETVPFIQVSNLARALQLLRDNDVWVVGTSGDAETSLYDIRPAARMALVMGSEGKGMRRLTREHCDELVFLPMRGTVESLNISVATGIGLFEVRRKIEAA